MAWSRTAPHYISSAPHQKRTRGADAEQRRVETRASANARPTTMRDVPRCEIQLGAALHQRGAAPEANLAAPTPINTSLAPRAARTPGRRPRATRGAERDILSVLAAHRSMSELTNSSICDSHSQALKAVSGHQYTRFTTKAWARRRRASGGLQSNYFHDYGHASSQNSRGRSNYRKRT